MSDLQTREDPYSVKQASRIFVLPNAMTAGNLFCGFWAVINCIQARLAETTLDRLYLNHPASDHYRYAVYLIFFAGVFDLFDGRLARMGGRESLFGAEFDSLADVVSFGVAPALMMFFLILSPSQAPDYLWFRNIGWFVGFVYLLCAAMRLARFNVITNPLLHRGAKESNKDFVGLPVPAAAGTVASVVLFLLELEKDNKSLDRFALALPFLMLLIAFLMMSTVRYPSGKTVNLQTRARTRTFLFAVIILGFVVALKEIALVTITMGYVLFGVFRHLRRIGAARKRATLPPFPTS
jgi:CDP-diacylglycerol--serine O-phosphatidyltransferase